MNRQRFVRNIRFLPVWEGVSPTVLFWWSRGRFPPCMGGCIVPLLSRPGPPEVSSLYGRVYRRTTVTLINNNSFLPVWEGVSSMQIVVALVIIVSSLYGRVYRSVSRTDPGSSCFLPTWEGVSKPDKWSDTACMFPPCMGGCITDRR